MSLGKLMLSSSFLKLYLSLKKMYNYLNKQVKAVTKRFLLSICLHLILNSSF